MLWFLLHVHRINMCVRRGYAAFSEWWIFSRMMDLIGSNSFKHRRMHLFCILIFFRIALFTHLRLRTYVVTYAGRTPHLWHDGCNGIVKQPSTIAFAFCILYILAILQVSNHWREGHTLYVRRAYTVLCCMIDAMATDTIKHQCQPAIVRCA